MAVGSVIAMIGMTGEKARRAIQLLGKQHAHEPVGERHRRQRDDRLRRRA